MSMSTMTATSVTNASMQIVQVTLNMGKLPILPFRAHSPASV
jgi:hypothetical protein